MNKLIVLFGATALVVFSSMADTLVGYDIRWVLTTDVEEYTPGCTIGWQVVERWERSPGFYYERPCETTCTVYRDGDAITNVVSSTESTFYTDLNVLPGSAYSYRVSACGLILKNAYTKTCKFICSAEIGLDDIVIEADGGTITVPVLVRKVYAASSVIASWDCGHTADWLVAEKSDDCEHVTVSARKNENGMSREGTVTISCNGYNWPIRVTQAGKTAAPSYSSWAAANGVNGAWDAKDESGIYNVFRYAFGVPTGTFSETPLIDIAFVDGKPVIKTPAVVNASGLTLSVEASDKIDGTGNVANYPLDASGTTTIEEDVRQSRFFRLKAMLTQ